MCTSADWYDSANRKPLNRFFFFFKEGTSKHFHCPPCCSLFTNPVCVLKWSLCEKLCCKIFVWFFPGITSWQDSHISLHWQWWQTWGHHRQQQLQINIIRVRETRINQTILCQNMWITLLQAPRRRQDQHLELKQPATQCLTLFSSRHTKQPAAPSLTSCIAMVKAGTWPLPSPGTETRASLTQTSLLRILWKGSAAGVWGSSTSCATTWGLENLRWVHQTLK